MKNLIKLLLKPLITEKTFFVMINNFTPLIISSGIKFYGLFPQTYFRGKNLLSSEPDTISFINDYVKDKDVYYDIGANIGIFSMYAALKKNCKVIAFEPESSNYFILNKNISLNLCNEQIIAFNIAINDKDEFSFLNLSENIIPGNSGNSFKNSLDINHVAYTPKFKQGVFGISLDSFIYQYNNPVPNHIKIDVDGNEYKIINGMKKVLNDENLITLAIEINIKAQKDIELLKVIEDCNFIKVDGYENPQSIRKGIVNYFFIRK